MKRIGHYDLEDGDPQVLRNALEEAGYRVEYIQSHREHIVRRDGSDNRIIGKILEEEGEVIVRGSPKLDEFISNFSFENQPVSSR